MKIMHIINNNIFGGGETVIFNIISELRSQYEFIYVCHGVPDAKIQSELKKYCIPYYIYSECRIKDIKDIINNIKPDIIHSHSYRTSIILAFSMTKIPVISHIHNYYEYLKIPCIKTLLYTICCLRFRFVIACQKKILYGTVFGILVKNKSRVIENTVNENKIKNLIDKENMDKIYDLIFVGHLIKRKDPLRFLQLVEKLSKFMPDLKVAIIGNGPLKLECKDYIKKNNISYVDMLGNLDNPYPVMKQSKILVLTSESEGLPMVALEALALSLWVVCTENCGLNDILTPLCGFICEKDEQIINRCKEILINKEEAVCELKTIEKYAEEIDEVYKYCQLGES